MTPAPVAGATPSAGPVHRLVDAHAHAFVRASTAHPRTPSALLPAAREASAVRLLGDMDAAGVCHAVLVEAGGNAEYVLSCAESNPARFSAILGLEGRSPEEIRQLARRRGVRGFRFVAINSPCERPADLEHLRPLLEVMSDSGLVLSLYADDQHLAEIERLLGLLPHLRVVLNHLGLAPDRLEVDALGRPRALPRSPEDFHHTRRSVVALARFANVFVIASGHYAFSAAPYPYEDLRDVSDELLSAFGPERMLVGSDAPFVSDVPGYRAALDVAPHHLPGIGESERAAILGGNAERLFGLSADLVAPPAPGGVDVAH